MYQHGQELEVTGELTELSPRFYSNGWGYGVLRVDGGKQLKVTGTLEGRSVGERLIVKGVWSTDSKYGPQINAHVVTPDAKNGTTTSIRSWFKKLSRAHGLGLGMEDSDLDERLADACENVCGFVDPALRWDTLASEAALVALGVKDAALIAEAARKQLELYRKVVQLQQWGFTDREIHKLGEVALEIHNAATVYRLVMPSVSFPFYRLDAIAQKAWQVDMLDEERIRAGVYFSMLKIQEEGHTATSVSDLGRAAAETLQLYPEHVFEWLAVQSFEGCEVGTALAMNLRLYEPTLHLQLFETARYEATIASYVRRTAERKDTVIIPVEPRRARP